MGRNSGTRVTTFADLVARVERRDTGCWEWQGVLSHHGYGRPWFEGRRQFAHRVFFEAVRGPIPDGLQLDHLCKNRRCVRPSHLEAVSAAENIARSSGVQVLNKAKTACIHGHPLDEANTYYTPDGRRNCRLCRLEAVRRYKNRKKVA